MDWNLIETAWNEYKASAKRQWDRLSEQQLAGTKGKREYLASRVREAYSLSKEEAERQVSDWQARQMQKPALSPSR